MSALTLDEQLIFDVAVAVKVKIPGFRKGVVEEGRFEIAKTIVEYLKSNRWVFSKGAVAMKGATAQAGWKMFRKVFCTGDASVA